MNKILIVEDERVMQMALEMMLKRNGYNDISTASDGVEAVDLVAKALDAEDHFDLICLDIMMPQMDGQEALEKIRALEDEKGLDFDARAKILMVTGMVDMENIEKAFKLANGYLIKPIQENDLLEWLNEINA